MANDGVKIARRGFLKLAAAGAAAGAAAAPERAEAFGLAQAKDGLAPDREVPTYCELCFWNCGVVARARKNRVLALKGHPAYPNANGKLCGRGQAGAGFVVDEDRLKYPMIRTGSRGEGKFRRAGWSEAYGVIADGFSRIKARYGAEALALFYHGSGGPLLRQMLVAYGSPNYAGPSYAQCKGARNVGYKLTFGEKIVSPEPIDLERTRCMVLFGSHLGENAHNSQVQEFVKARARGASLVVLDPRLSTVASKADVWLPIRPGYDTAVILAWLHLLVKERTYDAAFVKAHTVGLDALAAHVAPFTPEWAAERAGVPAARIVDAYRLMVNAMPAVAVHPGRHTAWYGEADTQRARAQAILTALLGAWWRPGGIYRTEKMSVPDYPTPDFPDLPKNVDEAAGRFPFEEEVTTNGIRDATRTGKPYPVKGWLVHGTNLIQSMPGVRETVDAIRNLDLLVVCDVLPTEITQYADVLLPEDTYLERWDDLSIGFTKTPYVGLRQPVVQSPHDTRPAWRIAKELGARLGVGDFFPWATFEDYLSVRLAGAGLSLDQLRKDGIALAPRKTPLYLADGEPFHFHTPSGKIELHSQQLADKGFAPLPTCEGPPLPPAGRFRLLYGRSPLHTFGRTQNNPILADLEPTNALWMSPADAAALGLEDGTPVLVQNDKGSETGPLPLKVTDRQADGAVYMVHGFGHWSRRLHRARGQGGDDTAVIDDYAVDPISGSTGMRTQLVTVRRAERTVA
ncbi:molybdopterin-containing oxidoreductase family protein [Anaeromyxobacter oryzae]|uniref:Nitrate reductase n=1 Tax=Anaeromyxobacter oryzae TaxID=2918170 RepID=A0ABN6MYI8_9BACT|nr:molybdopterin-dependent oxidoreductase [Anaeromyxobacter oryzae]BDG06032.1 nitrate reductase [Anaeromyxobacter oryzae]